MHTTCFGSTDIRRVITGQESTANPSVPAIETRSGTKASHNQDSD